MKIVGQ